jgi:hypothetical protein
MLLLTDTRLPNGSIFDYPILPSELGLIEEGMALVLSWSNGVGYAARSTGNGTEQFLGIAFAPRRELTAIGYKLSPFTIDPGAVNTLASVTFTDVHAVAAVAGVQAPGVFTTAPGTGIITPFTAITTGTPTTTQYKVLSLNPLSILFSEADHGVVVNIAFNYVPTLNDVTFQLGWSGTTYGQSAVDFVGTVPVLTQSARCVTDKFLANEDWFTAAGSPLHAAAGGYFSTGVVVSGTDISGQNLTVGPAYARVIAGPSIDVPGLVLAINL